MRGIIKNLEVLEIDDIRRDARISRRDRVRNKEVKQRTEIEENIIPDRKQFENLTFP